FGIAQSYPFVSRVREMLDQRQLTELERQVDGLLLDHIAETSEGHIFDEITVFAYFIELSLAARWLHRSASEGREKLRDILRKVLSNSALPQQVRADELAL
ncbi:MAG: DUF2764 family protein, partial [Leptospiraceae bacterium]|nr:DUF2764 family protein [Leptospiraceae bacterium]